MKISAYKFSKHCQTFNAGLNCFFQPHEDLFCMFTTHYIYTKRLRWSRG